MAASVAMPPGCSTTSGASSTGPTSSSTRPIRRPAAPGAAAPDRGGRWTVTVAQANGAVPPIDLPGSPPSPTPTAGAGAPGGSSAPVSRMARVWSTASRRAAGSATSGCAGARSVCSPWVTRCAPSTRCTGRACRRPRCRRPRFATWSRVRGRSWWRRQGGPRRSRLEPRGASPRRVPHRGRWRPARTGVFPVCRAFSGRLLDRYVDRVIEVARHDAPVTVAFMEVLNLLRPPQSLLARASPAGSPVLGRTGRRSAVRRLSSPGHGPR